MFRRNEGAQTITGALLSLTLLAGFGVPIASLWIVAASPSGSKRLAVPYVVAGVLHSLRVVALASVFACAVALAMLVAFRSMSPRLRLATLVILAGQMQVGLIPRLYGYLATYSDAGLVGSLGRGLLGVEFTSPLAFTTVGAAVAMTLVYGPLLWLPLCVSLERMPQSAYEVLDQFRITGLTRGVFIVKGFLRWRLFAYVALFLLVAFFDYAVSDLVGGGTRDAFAKTLYRGAVLFGDDIAVARIGALLALLIIPLFVAFRPEEDRL